MKITKFQIPKEIWKDKRIPKEAKYIYSYIYQKGFNRTITDINVGEIQQTIKIKNEGLKKKSWYIRTIKISNISRIWYRNVHNNT